MSERVLRANLFMVMIVTSCCMPTSGFPLAVFGFVSARRVIPSMSSTDFLPAVAEPARTELLWALLFWLSVPILGVLQLCILKKPGWKKFYRTVLPLFFLVAWSGVLVGLASWGSSWSTFARIAFSFTGIGLWSPPLVVTAAGIAEIVLMRREQRESSGDLS